MKLLPFLLLAVIPFAFTGAAHAQQGSPSLSVVYLVSPSQHYSLYGTVTHHVNLVVAGSITPVNHTVSVTVKFPFTFGKVTRLPSGVPSVLTETGQHPVQNKLVVTFPAGTSSFNFTVAGTFQDTSVLFRDVADIPAASISVDTPPFGPNSVLLLVQLTPQMEVFSTSPSQAQGAVIQNVGAGSSTYLETNFALGYPDFLVLYQPAYRDWFLVLYLVLIAAAVVLSVPLLRRIQRSTAPLAASLLRYVPRAIGWFDYKKLLGLLFLTSLLMVGLALVFGSSPTPRVYLAATPSTAKALGPLVAGSGYSYLTPNQASDEFDTLSNLGAFHSIVIADYPIPATSQGLIASTRIIVMTNLAPSNYTALLKTLYPNFVYAVSGNSSLVNLLQFQRQTYEGSNLGIPVSAGVYNGVLTTEAILSLLIPLFAMAFLARYIIESGGSIVTKPVIAMAASLFVFVFGEMVFAQTAVLLGIPVALHAALSPAETAGGALGLGGGSRPREVMGLVGFLFGIVAGGGGRLKIDRAGILAFLGVVFFLLADPLTGGQIFYQISLFLGTSVGGTPIGSQANNVVEGFMNNFMTLFGTLKTQAYLAQHGTVLYFAGAVPFAFYSRLRKTTATFLALGSAAVAGLGYIRIANQDLDIFKVLASFVPGVLIGLLVVLLFVGASSLEDYLRKRLALS